MPSPLSSGVGAATHSTLQLALGVAALLAGLARLHRHGFAFIWHTRSSRKVSSPDRIPEPPLNVTPARTATTG